MYESPAVVILQVNGDNGKSIGVWLADLAHVAVVKAAHQGKSV